MLLKLICLQIREENSYRESINHNWQDWELNDTQSDLFGSLAYTKSNFESIAERYSVRALALETGISKSQVSLSLKRSFDVGLARRSRNLDVPRTNRKALYEFIVYGLRYVFPAKVGVVTRGIATSLSAPVLKDKLISAGELPPVWPDALGNTKGQTVDPLFKSATYAVRRDAELYALLALVDAIRLGQPRERNIAIEQIRERMEIER